MGGGKLNNTQACIKAKTKAAPTKVPLGFDNVVATAERPPQQPGTRRSVAKKCEEDLESVDSFWGVGTAQVPAMNTMATAADTPAGKTQANRTPG